MTAGTWQRFCGLSQRNLNSGEANSSSGAEPCIARLWRVRAVLEVDLEVYATTPEEASTEARTALEDVQARVDALPGVWGRGGDLEQPFVAASSIPEVEKPDR